jgi:hypothetical protein
MHDGVLRLARDNAHSRDSRVSFDEAKHQYTVDGNVVVGSVSSLWGSRFERFDPEKTASRCYPKWARGARAGVDADVWTYTDRFVRLVEGGADEDARRAGVPVGWRASDETPRSRGYSRLLEYLWSKGLSRDECVESVVTLWSRLGEAASTRGTYVHLQCELHCNDEPFDEDAVEVRQYLSFRADHPALVPYRTEWSVFARLGAYVVAGQVDAVYRDAAGGFHMIDYKCCAHELTDENPFGKRGSAPFESVPDTPWGHYACQQNIYRYVLERFYGVSLESARLLRVHSSIDAYELVPVPDLRLRVARLFSELEEITTTPNFKLTAGGRWRRKIRSLAHVLGLLIYAKKTKKMASESDDEIPATQVAPNPSKRKHPSSPFDDAPSDSGAGRSDRAEDSDGSGDAGRESAPAYDWWRPEYDLLADKIMAEGGFPAKAGNFYLHEGLSALNDGELTVTSKLGGPLESASLIKETNSFYLQPRHDGQNVYAVFFGVAKERTDSTRFNDFRSTVRVRLDNVSQQDVVEFQGLPRWVFDKNKSADDAFEEFSPDQIYESVKGSTVYKMLESSFCLPLAAQVAKSKLSKEHATKGSDDTGKFVDKYIRERLGKIDLDDPYDTASTDFTWLRDKTKIGLPLTKDEVSGEWRTFIDAEDVPDADRRKPSFEFELPIRPDETPGSGKFDLRPGARGPKITRVDRDGKKSRATADDIVRDFPLREVGGAQQGTPVPNKMVMMYVQYDTLQNAKFAGPGLRCNVKEVVYVASSPQESVDDALVRFNS